MQDPRIADFLEALQLERDASPHTVTAYRTDLAELQAYLEALKKRYPAGFDSSLTLPCLRRIQEDRGYVADSDIEELAVFLGVPQIQIEEVLSFYTMFRRKPIGRWHLQFCHNVSCSMNGAERILEHVEKRLGLKPKVVAGAATPLNRVYSQDPAPGTEIPKGSTVTIRII